MLFIIKLDVRFLFFICKLLFIFSIILVYIDIGFLDL